MKQLMTAIYIAIGFSMGMLAGHYEGMSVALSRQVWAHSHELASIADLPPIQHAARGK